MRLQLSTLFVPMATRVNFWATKFISLVVFEQLNMPKASAPRAATTDWKPAAARPSASSQVAGRSAPPLRSRTRGTVKRWFLDMRKRLT